MVYILRPARTAETMETIIFTVARLFEMKESKRPVELTSMAVTASREVLFSSGTMLAERMSSFSK